MHHYVFGVSAERLRTDGFTVTSSNPYVADVGTIDDEGVDPVLEKYHLALNPVTGHLYDPCAVNDCGSTAQGNHFSELIECGAQDYKHYTHRLYVIHSNNMYRLNAEGKYLHNCKPHSKHVVMHTNGLLYFDFPQTSRHREKWEWEACDDLCVRAGIPSAGPYKPDFVGILAGVIRTMDSSIEVSEISISDTISNLQDYVSTSLQQRAARDRAAQFMSDKRLEATVDRAFSWPYLDQLSMGADSWDLTTEKLEVDKEINCEVLISYKFPNAAICTLSGTRSYVINAQSKVFAAIVAASLDNSVSIPYTVCKVQELLETLTKGDFTCVKAASSLATGTASQ